VEYSFQESTLHPVTTITLRQYSMIIKKGADERCVAYASILQVKLYRSVNGIFKLYVYGGQTKPFIITNKTCVNPAVANQSSAYTTFVKTLHFYLRNRSAAAYQAARPVDKVFAFFIVFFFFLLPAFVILYCDVRIVDPCFRMVILTLIFAIVLDWANKNATTPYTPSDIPLQFLP
jgi:hypothetical protein